MERESATTISHAADCQAAFSHEALKGGIPDDVEDRARLVLLDTLGCMVLGSRLETKIKGLRATTLDATSLILRTELYEGNRFAHGHPAVHIVPALVFCQDADRLSIEEALRILVASYEVASRWGMSIRMSLDFLGHGSPFNVGAAVAEGLIRGFGRDKLRDAILLTASLPVASVWQSVWEGSALHDFYPGLGALAAEKALELAERGACASGDLVRSAWVDILRADFDDSRLAEGMGDVWLITKNYFKDNSGCRFANMYTDALAKMMASDGVNAQNVESITVRAYEKASRLDGITPSSRMYIHFSIPCLLAVQLLEGNVEPTSIDYALAHKREEVVSLAKRIRVCHDVGLDALLPDTRAGKLEVDLSSGEAFEQQMLGTPGDFDGSVPYGSDEVLNKFHRMCDGAISPGLAERLEDLVMRGGDSDTVGLLRGLLMKAIPFT